MESKAFEPSVKGLFILDEEGNRIYAKYWTGECKITGNIKSQKEFEKRVAKKTMSMANMADADAIGFEKFVLVFKRLGDNTVMYVLGSPDENELMLATVLTAFEESVSALLRGQLDANSLLQGLAEVCLCADEIVMDGLIMETDSMLIAGRASMAQTLKQIPIQDQTLQQFANSAKEKLANVFR
uniref:Coatomer subunit zeta n=1 Tax=Norrisiella sphaerica TaxID=552664 RepID=A0A7S2QT11_9EUKA|mmetsp:Transcript_2357/g.3391  ORF Transcript_2357/g.3391 Transcript_2357/m.3391 type:complete len:184 (+) Transcript_2357:77-628(+)|eukprot:CAMPEP_0184480250 /NCGR_PEP_ID=MMETSP0113_2-20130426/1745_1 /TAXON_ID=91329 /ORGANISM="Norrisiella sphaerica, Strain BC52" /LENGTH=183 /DNA_ID=CAMNT_0026858607 /DNA_START=66 /DNA_END=617 /DNA_ORIENTATION=-